MRKLTNLNLLSLNPLSINGQKAFSIEYAAFSIEYAVFSIEYATFSIEYATYSIGGATFSTEYAAFSIEYATFSIEYAAFFLPEVRHTYSIENKKNTKKHQNSTFRKDLKKLKWLNIFRFAGIFLRGSGIISPFKLILPVREKYDVRLTPQN